MFNFLIKKKINSAFDNNMRKHNLKRMEAIESVLILFSYEDWAEINVIAKDLTDCGKKVHLWTVRSNKNKSNNIALPPNVRLIRKNETSYSNILSSAVVLEFQALKFDTLLDLTTNHNNIFNYLLAHNSSEFSIGIYESEHRAYDFVILKDEKNSLSETYTHLKFYLNNVY